MIVSYSTQCRVVGAKRQDQMSRQLSGPSPMRNESMGGASEAWPKLRISNSISDRMVLNVFAVARNQVAWRLEGLIRTCGFWGVACSPGWTI